MKIYYPAQHLHTLFTLRNSVRATQVKQESKSTIAVLDGIRAIAALLVAGFHIDQFNHTDLWPAWKYPLPSALITFGGSGVTLFFVLSGFLLFMPYARALLFEAKWPSARQFYIRRALRILPGYYVALTLIVIFFQPQYLQPAYWKRLLLFITMFMDSTPQTVGKLNGPFWTLAIEWQFYMLMPLLMLGFSLVMNRLQGVPKRRFFIVLGCCLVLITYGLAMRYIGIYCARHPDQTFHLPHIVLKGLLFFLFGMNGKYLENFAMGMIICTCYIYAQHPKYGVGLQDRLQQNSRWLRRLGLVLLLFTAIWHFQVLQMRVPQFDLLNPWNGKFSWLNEMIIATGYSAWILAILFGSRALTGLFSFTPLLKLGMISFSLYMWHLPLLHLYNDKILPHLHLVGPHLIYLSYWIWFFIFIVPFSTASYLLVERPFMKLRARAHRNDIPAKEQLHSMQA